MRLWRILNHFSTEWAETLLFVDSNSVSHKSLPETNLISCVLPEIWGESSRAYSKIWVQPTEQLFAFKELELLFKAARALYNHSSWAIVHWVRTAIPDRTIYFLLELRLEISRPNCFPPSTYIFSKFSFRSYSSSPSVPSSVPLSLKVSS